MSEILDSSSVSVQGSDRRRGWVPTRKWIVGQITALGAVLTMVVTTGGWSQEATIALVGLLVAAATSYLVPNLGTPGGVPAGR